MIDYYKKYLNFVGQQQAAQGNSHSIGIGGVMNAPGSLSYAFPQPLTEAKPDKKLLLLEDDI